MEVEARDLITQAQQFTANGSYSKAFDFYIMAFEKNRGLKARYEDEFGSVLTKLNGVLLMANKVEDVFYYFGRAIDVFPTNIYLVNDLGRYLYKFGFYTEAWAHFQRALKVDSGFVNAEKNLNSIKNLLVERWHFRMLNDKIRNDAYRAAIRETIIPYIDTVLDVGTGTGVLAIYANECSPAAVTGCDVSEVMTKLAESILEENNIQQIVIVNNMSTNMNYRDIGGKRSVLVTEMFDAGLFGEQVLPTLAHARQNLMTDAGRIVPHRAEFFIMCARSERLSLRYHLAESVKTQLNIPSLNVLVLNVNESYDSDDIHFYKDIKYMTKAKSLFKIDFNNLLDIQRKLKSRETYTIVLKALEDGVINTIIGWFKLYLTDNITVTTDPRAKNRANAWQQAIFLGNRPWSVRKGQTVELEFVIEACKLTMYRNWDGIITKLTPETLRFLNDSDYINMINKCIGNACIYLGQIAVMSEINIVDLCPFPYFGFLMLKRGAQSITCCARNEFDKRFFKEVFLANDIPLSKVNLLMGDEWSHEVFHDEKFHAIYCNIFEMYGEIDFRQREIAQHLRNRNLLPGGLFMPANITIMGQLVKSHWLDINNRLYDKNVSDYKMAMHVNKYQVSQSFCTDYSSLEYTPLSEPASLGQYSSDMISEVINVPIIRNGFASAILCWYNIEVMEELGEITTKRGNCFIDGTVFLANPEVCVVRGKMGNILRCIDSDGAFKLVIDGEAT